VVDTATEELLSLPEAADRLGVSVYTVRRWIKDGKLRAFKPGKEYRIREVDLEEFLQAREVRPKGPAPHSPEQPSLNGLLEEERRRAEYAPRVEPRINLLEREVEQWERLTDEGLYDPKKLGREVLDAIDAVSLQVVINHAEDARGLKQACTPEQLERLEQAEKRYFDANLEFWAHVEKDEQAKKRRANFAPIQGGRSA
jgi:excisionase family DNA binding protein